MLAEAEDRLKLSTFIKGVHKQLRKEATMLGTDLAWEKHCKNEEVLQEYSKSMKKLASHWENKYKTNGQHLSRVTWTYENCTKYFFTDWIEICRKKELEIFKKIEEKSFTELPALALDCDKSKPLFLLDVGSCYNPFKDFNCFKVLPIDIAPADEEVLKCDFVNVKTDKNILLKDGHVEILPEKCFDIVVFSLLLEYLPSAYQRHLCCKNSYKLLKPEGLLVIITPDSNHVGINAKYMKSWRFILAEMGFSRIKYEKLPHLHCMLFRKSISKEIPIRWTTLKDELAKDFYHEMFIPQDFR